MSTPENSSPEPDAATPRRRGPARPLIAVGIVALVVIVVVAAIVPRITASRPSTSTTLCCAPRKAAAQVLSLSMNGYGDTPANLIDVTSLDPVMVSGDYLSTVQQLVHLLFDGLVTLDDANNVEMWGADHVTVSSDGLTYTFHLSANQSFSDGTPVKPSDYAWSLDRALNPCVADFTSTSESALAVIKDGVAFASEDCASDYATVRGKISTLIGDSIVPDDSAGTLTITLQHAAGYFLAALAQPSAFVVERQAMNGLGTDGAWLANLTSGPTGRGGSGMFYLASDDSSGSLVLKPNPHWWGQSAGKLPNFTELDVHLYSDSTLDYSSFLSSSYDYVDASPRDSLIAAQSKPDYHLTPDLQVSTIAFNWKLAPFDNADARQALCLALNRDAIAQQVLQSYATNSGAVPYIPTWHLVPQGMPGYNSHLTGIDGVTATSGDLAKAEAHWQAYLATLRGKAPPPVAYIYSQASQAQVILANDVVAHWSNAFPGLSVSKKIPEGLLQEGDVPQYQTARFGWLADYPDPQDFLSKLYSTSGVYNEWNSSVPSADALLAQADTISDPTEQASRLNRYNQAEQQLVQQVATCPLFQYQTGYLLRSSIYGLRQNGQGYFADDDWVMGYRTA
jgi:oligopeptide transport system substrate-binding protein